MRKKFLVVFFILLFLLSLSVTSATDENTNSSVVTEDYTSDEFYVDLGGNDNNSGQANSPFNSINKAVEVSDSKVDTVIHLGEGTFEGNGNVMVSINKGHLSQGGSITIVGQGANKTIIQGSDAYYAFNIYTDSIVTLRNLSIVNCKSVEGGAISNSGTLLVDNCVFKNNFAFTTGGAIASLQYGDCKVYNSVFINNSVTCNDKYDNAKGGAIYSLNSDLLVDSCKFIGNYAKGNCLNAISGGAIYVGAYLNNVPYVKNSNFINNYVVSTTYRTNWEYAKGGSIYMIHCDLFNDSFINSSVIGNNGVGGSYYSEPRYLNSISNILRINSTVNGVLENNIYPKDYNGTYSEESIVYVSVNGDDKNGNGSLNNPYATLANAIAKASGNVYNLKVYLLSGTYSGENNTNITLPSSMNIQIIGSNSNVVIDGENSNWFVANERSISDFKYGLANLTLINFKAKSFGYDKEDNIGVISNYADLTIDSCVFKNIMGSVIANYDLGNLKVNNSVFTTPNAISSFYGGVLFNYDANARFYNCIIDNYTSLDIFYSTAVNTQNVYLKFFNSTFKDLTSLETRFKVFGLSNTNITLDNVNYVNNKCNFLVSYDESSIAITDSVFKNSNWLNYYAKGLIWDVYNSSFINIDSLSFISSTDSKSNFNLCLFDGGNVEFRGNIITVANSSFYTDNVSIVNNNQNGNLDFNYNYWGGENPKNMISTQASVKLDNWIVKNLTSQNLFNDSFKLAISYKLSDGNNYDIENIPIKPTRFILITSKGVNSIDSGTLTKDIFEFINTASDDRVVVASFEDNTKLNTTLYNQHKVDINMDLSQKTLNLGDIVKININLKDNKTALAVDEGIVEIYLNNKLISSNNVTGVVISKEITANENKSFYNVSVVYKGNNKYADSLNSDILRISSIPLETTIISKDLTKYYKNQSQFDIVLKDVLGNVLVGKTVKITINGVTYNRVTNNSGEARLSINLCPGNYNITTSFEDDGYVKSSNTNKVVVLSKIATSFVDNNKFIVKLVNDDGTPKTNASVAIIANGVQYTRITNSSGEAKLNVGLNPNEYIFTVSDGLEVVLSNVNVLSTIKTSDISMFYKDGTKFSAKVYDNDGKIAVNQQVAITVNGVTYNKLTDSEGVASLNINLNPGVHHISTSYNGKTLYNIVSIAAMPVTIVSSSVNIQQGSSYKVKFSNALSNPIVGQEVGILINGIMYHRVTDDLGVVSININLNPGNYVITSGLLSSGYEAKTMNNIITVNGG